MAQDTDARQPEKKTKIEKDLSTANVRKVLKTIISATIYDEDDIKKKDGDTYIDLCYDTRRATEYIVDRIRERFPDNMLIKGTKIYILSNKNRRNFEYNKRNKTSIKAHRRDQQSRESTPRDEADTDGREQSAIFL
jgi:hypothetical protein